MTISSDSRRLRRKWRVMLELEDALARQQDSERRRASRTV